MNKLPERIRIKDIARLADVSVGTVDRVLHGRTGVSEASRKRVEEILKQLDYQPNMYASALASNKKYLFVCLLPQHKEGDYWTDVELGMKRAVETFSDFHITLSVMYYDQYEYSSFINAGEEILKQEPDGVLLAPTIPEMTARFTDKLQEREIPYIFIDSNVASLNPLAFFGQKSDQSGYFAARMAMMLGECPKEIVIFRQINEGRLGSNQQENREKGFRKYMQEPFPDCKIVELNLYAKRPDEDEALMNRFFPREPTDYVRHHFQLESVHYRRISHRAQHEKFQTDWVRFITPERLLSERGRSGFPDCSATYRTRIQRRREPVQSPDLQERGEAMQLHAHHLACGGERGFLSGRA